MKIAAPVIETVPIDKIKPWEKNPRVKHAVAAIEASIGEFGYLNPIIVQKGTYRILAGHGRYKALKAMKTVKEIPVAVADVTDEQAAAYTIADNKLNDSSSFDKKSLATLFETLDARYQQLSGFTAGEINALGVGNLQTTGAANEVDVDQKSATLFVTFPTREKMLAAKREIGLRQKGNEKSEGQVLYEALFPGKS